MQEEQEDFKGVAQDEVDSKVEVYDQAADKMAESAGTTDLAESFDKTTKTMAIVEVASQTLNVATGTIAGVEAGIEAAASMGMNFYADACVAMAAVGVGFSVTGIVQQAKVIDDVSKEINQRELTQTEIANTDGVYNEALDYHTEIWDELEETEFEVDDELLELEDFEVPEVEATEGAEGEEGSDASTTGFGVAPTTTASGGATSTGVTGATAGTTPTATTKSTPPTAGGATTGTPSMGGTTNTAMPKSFGGLGVAQPQAIGAPPTNPFAPNPMQSQGAGTPPTSPFAPNPAQPQGAGTPPASPFAPNPAQPQGTGTPPTSPFAPNPAQPQGADTTPANSTQPQGAGTPQVNPFAPNPIQPQDADNSSANPTQPETTQPQDDNSVEQVSNNPAVDNEDERKKNPFV